MTTVCTSRITDMSAMFGGLRLENFSQDISAWDVSNVTTMDICLYEENFNQDLSAWDVSNVTTMSGMFSNADFLQPRPQRLGCAQCDKYES